MQLTTIACRHRQVVGAGDGDVERCHGNGGDGSHRVIQEPGIEDGLRRGRRISWNENIFGSIRSLSKNEL